MTKIKRYENSEVHFGRFYCIDRIMNNNKNTTSSRTRIRGTLGGRGGGPGKQPQPQLKEEEEQQRLSILLWKSTFEMFCHQILYVRKLYPKDSFMKTRHLGVQCYVNRHPDIVSYITETVSMATHALIEENTSTAISTIIFDQITLRSYEKYTFSFDNGNVRRRNTASTTSIEEQEQDSREFVLSILTLQGITTPNWGSSMTFRIELFVPNKIKSESRLNDELIEGKWFCTDRQHQQGQQQDDDDDDSNVGDSDDEKKPSANNNNTKKKEVTKLRHVYQMKSSDGKFHFQINMDDDSDDPRTEKDGHQNNNISSSQQLLSLQY